MKESVAIQALVNKNHHNFGILSSKFLRWVLMLLTLLKGPDRSQAAALKEPNVRSSDGRLSIGIGTQQYYALLKRLLPPWLKKRWAQYHSERVCPNIVQKLFLMVSLNKNRSPFLFNLQKECFFSGCKYFFLFLAVFCLPPEELPPNAKN